MKETPPLLEELAPYSLAEANLRIQLWLRQTPQGFSRVFFVSERQQRQVTLALRDFCNRVGRDFEELEFPKAATPQEGMQLLLQKLAELPPHAVVSLRGFEGTFLKETRTETADALMAFNASREALRDFPLHLLLWVPGRRELRELFPIVIPDINRFFALRIDLIDPRDILAETVAPAFATLLVRYWTGNFAPAPSERAAIERVFLATTDRERAGQYFRDLGQVAGERLLPLLEAHQEVSITSLREVLETLSKPLCTLTPSVELGRATPNVAALRQWLAVGEESRTERALATTAQTLYRELVNALTQFLLAASQEFAPFLPEQPILSLERLLPTRERLLQVLQRAGYMEEEVVAVDNNADLTRDSLDYRHALVRELDQMELFGARLDEFTRTYPLSVSYISLRLKQSGMSRNVELVLDSLKSTQRVLLITGAAGTGKSTLLKWMTVTAAGAEPLSFEAWRAKHAPTAPRNVESDSLPPHEEKDSRKRAEEEAELRQTYDSLWRFQVPFLVRLRELERGEALPAPEAFPAWLAKRHPLLNEDWVTELFREGKALLLFDGLDEVPTEDRMQRWQELGALVQHFSHNRFVFSSRPMEHELSWLHKLNTTYTELDFLDTREKGLLITQWYKALAGKRLASGMVYKDELSAEELVERGQLLKRRLSENLPASALAQVPLLCALLCALFSRTKYRPLLPNTLPELCETTCRMLLHERALESNISLTEFHVLYRELRYEEKKALVQALAVRMVLHDILELSFEESCALLHRVLGPGRCPEQADAEAFMKTFVTLSGVLQFGSGDTVQFIHNTLKEYLAADELADYIDIERLTQKPEDPMWQNIVLFAAHRRPIGHAILKRLSEKDNRAAQLLFLRCWAITPLPPYALEVYKNSLCNKFLPPSDEQEAIAIAVFGNDIISHLRYNEAHKEKTAAACIHALRRIDSEQAREYIQEYAEKETRHPALNALTLFYNPLFVKWIQNGILYAKWEFDHVKKSGKEYRERINQDHFTEFLQSLNCNNITSLILSNTNIDKIEGLESCTQLRELYLDGTAVSKIEGLESCTQLQWLYLDSTAVSKIEGLESCTQLQELYLDSTAVSKIEGLESCTQLRRIYLNNTAIGKIEGLESCTQLQGLFLHNTAVSKIEGLESCTQLKGLYLNSTAVSKIEGLESCTQLEGLYLNSTSVSKIEGLENCTRLHMLSLDSTAVSKIEGLENCTRLHMLSLDSTAVSKIEGLESLMQLEVLSLNNTAVKKIEGLKSCKDILEITLDSTAVSKIEGLENCIQLGGLFLNSTAVSKIEGLENCTRLQRLFLKNTVISEDDVENFRNKHPQCDIAHSPK